jgi:hypothetical protein
MIDNLPFAWFNGKFEIKKYNLIRRLQRHVRRKFNKKTALALIIQRGCHNWLYKGICKDGTLGINVKIGLDMIEKSDNIKFG